MSIIFFRYESKPAGALIPEELPPLSDPLSEGVDGLFRRESKPATSLSPTETYLSTKEYDSQNEPTSEFQDETEENSGLKISSEHGDTEMEEPEKYDVSEEDSG